ncbi:MAG: c-type cytochrome biogenesis protein CcmI [Nitrospira sp.]|nr:c-type cytochrome biogenesis protein CcmI [Nitrospira sp.]
MTLIFVLLAAMLTVAILAVLVRPLLKQTAAAVEGEQEKTLPVYRQQFVELEQDKASGLLTEDQYQAARRELEHRLLEEVGSASTVAPIAAQSVNVRGVAVALVLVVPTVSGVLYWALGNPIAMTHPATNGLATSVGETDDGQLVTEGLNTLIERLRQRLEQNPDDGTGWTLLARSYMVMERYAEAVPVFEKAVALNPNDATLLADYADALGVHQGRKLDGKPEALIQKALKLDPNNVKALMLSGTVAFNRKDFASAIRDWELARANLPAGADPESFEQLTASIAEAKRRMGGAPVMAAANVPLAQSSMPPNHPPVGQRSGSHAITGTVVLAQGMEAKASGAETLFVFAKDPNGPPMPVSIVRATRKDLPFSFRLDDSTSPMPSRKLSDLETVVIVARLSKSGTAMPASGDLEGVSPPVKPGTEGITIVIDRQRP